MFTGYANPAIMGDEGLVQTFLAVSELYALLPIGIQVDKQLEFLLERYKYIELLGRKVLLCINLRF